MFDSIFDLMERAQNASEQERAILNSEMQKRIASVRSKIARAH